MSAHDMDDALPDLPADLKQALPRYKAPPGLERRVRHMLRGQDPQPARRVDRLLASWSRAVPAVVAFACGVVLTVGLVSVRDARDLDTPDEEIIAGHVRSLMANHLTDVASTDRHTVKPWFTGKLDYAPPVVDLAQEGFPLIGGRLDFVDKRPVAALVYRHGAHTINLYVLPAVSRRAPGDSFAVKHGFQLARWEKGGMRYWAVSDIGHDEMAQFVAALKAAS